MTKRTPYDGRNPDDAPHLTDKDDAHLARVRQRVNDRGIRCWGDPDETYVLPKEAKQ